MSARMAEQGKEMSIMRENNTIITVRLADNETDRDYERFSVSALHDMAKLYAGRNGVIGEDINGKRQWGRILSCEVRTNPNKLTRSGEIYTYLEARVIIPRTNENDKLLNDFECVWEKEVSRSIKVNDKSRAVEKLFKWKGEI